MRVGMMVAACSVLFWTRVPRSTADCNARLVNAIRTLHPRPEQEFDGMLDHLDKEYQVMMLSAEEENADGQALICMKGTFIGEMYGTKILEYSGFINGAYSMEFKNGSLQLQDEDGNEEMMLRSHIVYFTHEVVAMYTCPANDIPAQATVAVSSWFIGKVDDQLRQVQDLFKQVGINSFSIMPHCRAGQM